MSADEGELRILDERPGAPSGTRPCLVLMLPSAVPDRYGAGFIQFPERGRPGGGSAWAYPASAFRDPVSWEEHLWVALYKTAKRVLDLKAELAGAEAMADGVRTYATYMGLDLRP